jgi:putative tryptophan/tyrosine transport system substrate-binding protein
MPEPIETAFATFSQQRVGAVLVGGSNFYNRHPEQLAALAARHALPAIYPNREFALAGGLCSATIMMAARIASPRNAPVEDLVAS